MSTSSINDQSVQATMLIPLWGRAKYSEQNPQILNDAEAKRIIKQCDFDFSGVEKSFGELSGLCYVVRARKIDNAIRGYIAKHPRATVVNIGVGLDTTFSRVDNGLIHWYNLDLPDAIAYRKTLIPDSERNSCIAKSVLDTSWFDDIIFKPANGIMFVSGGVFYYLHEEDLKVLFAKMTAHFPGGELYFDAETAFAVKGSNRAVRKSGNTNAMMYFAVNDAKMFEQWSSGITSLPVDPMFKGIAYSKKWRLGTRMLCRVNSLLKVMFFVHLRFAPLKA